MQHRADLELARRTTRADDSAFGAFFEDAFDRVYAFVERRTATRKAAEDATERILVRAFGQLAGYDGDTPFSAWLLAIVKQELRGSGTATRRTLVGGAGETRSGA
jgi:DNA-directed RNA polymerase specialized sigma24 family protein